MMDIGSVVIVLVWDIYLKACSSFRPALRRMRGSVKRYLRGCKKTLFFC